MNAEVKALVEALKGASIRSERIGEGGYDTGARVTIQWHAPWVQNVGWPEAEGRLPVADRQAAYNALKAKYGDTFGVSMEGIEP